MNLSRSFPLVGGLLLTALLAGCSGKAQAPKVSEPSGKATADDGHGHAADSTDAKAETGNAADPEIMSLNLDRMRVISFWSTSDNDSQCVINL